MRKFTLTLVALLVCASHGFAAEKTEKTAKKASPVKALLITGGCCHDYPFQAEKLIAHSKGVANIEWTVVNEGGKGTKAQIELYDNPDWAKGYDVVVHNECFANTADEAYIKKITSVHKAGVPAVVIHCAMHTYRASKIMDWREFLGVTSFRHEHKAEYAVTVEDAKHPTMMGFPKDWKTPSDELYVIDKLWPNAKSLATSKSERTGKVHPVFWTNQYGKARVFGTTYGHSKETFEDKIFLGAVTRGLLWAADKLDKDGKPNANVRAK